MQNESGELSKHSKAVRINGVLADYVDKECSEKGLKPSAVLDSIFENATNGISALQNDGNSGDQKDQTLMRQKRSAQSKAVNDQDDSFLLLDKQLTMLSETTGKYSRLSHFVTLASEGIKAGLTEAQSAVEKTSNEMNQASINLNKSSVLASERIDSICETSQRYDKITVDFETRLNRYFESEIKIQLTHAIDDYKSNMKKLFRATSWKAYVGLSCAISSLIVLVIATCFSWSPLSSHNREMTRQNELYRQAWSDVGDKVCGMKSTPDILEIKKHFCK